MTVAELNSRMSAREFSEWMEYYQSEPFGPVRDNIHSGQITAMLFNANRRKGQRPMTAADFLLMSEKDRMKQRTEKTMQAMREIAKSGKKKRGR
jgi:hypothetical protein